MHDDYEPREPETPEVYEATEEAIKKENRVSVILAIMGTIGVNLLVVIVLLPIIRIIERTSAEQADLFTDIWGNFIVYSLALTAMVIYLSREKELLPLVKQFKKISAYKWGVIFGVAVIAAQLAYGMLTQTLFGDIPVNQNQESVVEIIKMQPLVAFIWIPFVGPLVEELTYRRGIFARLRKINFPIAIVVTSLIFGLVHFNLPLNVAGELDLTLLSYELINLPSYIISGLIFCFVYEEHGFAAAAVAHIFNNLFAFALTFIT